MPDRRACATFLAATVATAALWVGAPAAQAATVAEVVYPERVNVAGQPLRLNGAGIRYRFVVRVYTAGLYLAAPASTTEAVLDAPGPKRLHVQMLREINADQLGRLFTRGMQDNTPREEFVASIPGTLRLGEIFAARKQLSAGDHFSVDWVPGVGTTIRVNGEPQGAPIKEPAFFRSLMRIWLGSSPADALLKDALLGKPPADPAANPN